MTAMRDAASIVALTLAMSTIAAICLMTYRASMFADTGAFLLLLWR